MLRPLSLSISPNGGLRYKQPETPFDTRSYSLTDIMRRVANHRRSVPSLQLDTAEGWEDRLKSDLCVQNPQWRCEEFRPGEIHPLVIEGRARWAELHDYAAAYPETPTREERASAQAWLAGWRQRIPEYRHCKCREGFAELEKRTPFDLLNRRSFWRSAVALHDSVNKKLGKPLFADKLLDRF